MNQNQELKNRGVPFPALIIFSAVYILFSVFTVLDPIGLLGLLLIPVTAAFLAFLIFAGNSAVYAILTVFSIAVCYFAVGDIASALIPLLPMTIGIFLGLTVSVIKSRTHAIAISSFINLLILGFIACLVIYQLKGYLNIELIRSLIDEGISYIKELNESLTVTLNGETVYFMDPQALELTLPLAFSIMPSVAFTFLMLASYLSSYILLLICKAFRIDDQLLQCEWHITMSRISAVLLVISFFIAQFLSIGNNFTLISVSANILQILTPPFALIGFRLIIFGLRFKRIRTMMIVLLVLFGLMLLIFPSLAFMMVAGYGVFYTVTPKIHIVTPPDDGDQ